MVSFSEHRNKELFSTSQYLLLCVASHSNIIGQPFFYMAFACCVNVYNMVSVHTSSM